jgi:uncharacterized YccA/Bax inhibitor family protein
VALNNPAFADPAFQQKRPGLTPPTAAGAQTQYATAAHQGIDAAAQARLEGMYAAPSAGAVETNRMSVEDTVVKTLTLFGILLVGAVVGWVWTFGGALGPTTAESVSMAPWLIGALGGFVLAMVITFTSRKKVRPALIFSYAALEGLFVGGISGFFEAMWPGIVVQATLATLAVVGVTLALFASGKVRASARATKIFLIAMIGYAVFSLLNVGLMLFGVLPENQMFGMYSQPVFGIPLGLIIGVLVVIMAAYSLVLDFDSIQQGVRNGAPRQYAWVGAFGIMVTVVWLYVEILRMIAILRGSD